MDILDVNGVAIRGVTACVPPNIKENAVECAELFGPNIKNMLKATGVHSRYVVDPGVTTLDLGVCAAQKLLRDSGTDPDDIGAVISVTLTPEYTMPGDVSSAQHRLSIPKHCAALDIYMGCCGYIYGLYIAATFVKALNKKVLLLDGDVNSHFTSPYDKSTLPLFSDISTATLLEPSRDDSWRFSFYTDGAGRESLYIPAGGVKKPIEESDLRYIEYEGGIKRRNIDLYMDGMDVFSFTVTEVAEFLKSFMEKCKMTADNIDGFIPHQANMSIVRRLAKKLEFSTEQTWKSGETYGNPGSASVPLTIANCAESWFGNGNGGKVLLSGFGSGLSIGACCMKLPKTGHYSIIQYKKQ